MAKSGVEVQGLSRVVRSLKEMGAEIDDLKNAFSKIAALGASKAKKHTPRRTGRLANDIRGNRAQSKAVIAAGRATVPYAGAINYGWKSRNIAPSGFMQKADVEMQPIALQMLETEIDSIIKKKDLK